ncbi:hypothetical protein EVAR_96924_1 [Eumeta japonica]|uniref:Uncharacterized protein n=1 Tax=Eumeta variegata TaxID=151549 RepID=A0A4C2A4R7_EUMVA|nr:hypothetical protein EVAR_96924_1 [Eumeta japonica]
MAARSGAGSEPRGGIDIFCKEPEYRPGLGSVWKAEPGLKPKERLMSDRGWQSDRTAFRRINPLDGATVALQARDVRATRRRAPPPSQPPRTVDTACTAAI